MTILFSVRDIAEAAVEKEKRRRAFYAKVCELSTDRRLKDLFQFLADEEDKHVAAFTRLRDSLPPETRAEEYDEEMDAYMTRSSTTASTQRSIPQNLWKAPSAPGTFFNWPSALKRTRSFTLENSCRF
jgi:rubrerythrin